MGRGTTEHPGVRRPTGQRRLVARGGPGHRPGAVAAVPEPEIGRTATGGTAGAGGILSSVRYSENSHALESESRRLRREQPGESKLELRPLFEP